MADSRPAPGPFTFTSTVRTPCSCASCAAFCAATCAANGVPLREPLKPMRPALDQARMQLLQQLVAAELNASAFGSTPSSGSFTAWETALCGTDQNAIKNAQQQAASFNLAQVKEKIEKDLKGQMAPDLLIKMVTDF